MRSTGSSTSSSQARPASPSRLPGIDWGSTESRGSCSSSSGPSETLSMQAAGSRRDTSSGRTFQEHSPAVRGVRKGLISDACSKPWMSAGSVFRGEYWTANLPEYQTGRLVDSEGRLRNAAGASTLSESLERTAPGKYSLSARACKGIIRRAERHGKSLPPTLAMSLRAVIEREME